MSNSHLTPRPVFLPAARQQPSVPATDPRPTGPVFTSDESASSLECLRTLYRRKGSVLLISLLGVLLAGLVCLVQPRLYRSVASLEVQGINENFLNLRDIDPAATPGSSSTDVYVKTQAEILQQDALIQQVAEKLNLSQRAEFRRPLSVWDRLRGIALQDSSSPAARRYTAEVVSKHLHIEPSRDSQLIRIAFESRDPQFAADFANQFATTFIEDSVARRRRAAQEIQDMLGPRLEQQRKKLQNSEAELDAYTRASGLILTTGQDTLATDRLRTVQDQLSKAHDDVIAKQSQFEQINKNPVELTADNPVLRDYDLKLTDLRRQSADLESILKPESYKVVRLKAQITQLESAVRKETRRAHQAMQNDLMAAEHREVSLAREFARQSSVVSQMTAKVTRYNALKHEVDTNRQFYEAMAQKVNDAGIASAVRQSNIRLAAPAEPALYPFKPNVPLNLSIGLLAGLMVAIASVMMSDQANARVRAPGEAGVCLNVPELGTIPKAESAGYAPRLLGFRDTAHPVERITWDRRFSPVAESFRSTAASLLSAERSGAHSNVLVITSSLPGEGKTTVASNLGIALAEVRGRVLLIDGDMRRPRLHKVFGVGNSWGLSDILQEQNAAEELPLEALVKKTPVPHLYVLPSGPCTDSIFTLLYSERMERLMDRFGQEFDYVIVDAPPCLEFADARVLARYASGVLLVLRADYAERKTAQAAAQRLLLDGVAIVGTVLNHWDAATWGDAYGYYGSYHSVYDHPAS